MSISVPTVRDNDWVGVRKAIYRLASLGLGPTSSPTFAGLTLTGLTASKLIATDSDKTLSSTDLVSWVTGTSGIITVTDDTDGTITLNISDLTDPGADRMLFWDESSNKITWCTFGAVSGLTISGTTFYWDILNIAQLSTTPTDNSMMVFDGVSGGMLWEVGNTLNTTLGLGTGSSPTFAGLTLTGYTGVLKAVAGTLTSNADHIDLGNITSDQHHAQIHAASHEIAGGDLVDHDNLTNYVANEHIDHTGVTLTAGVALAGGGDISANRTFNLDITELAADGAPDGAADYVVTYDADAAAHKKVLLDNLPGGGGGDTYTDRGDPAAWDWDLTADFTYDGNWHEIDCSGIVPVGTKYILFRMEFRYTVTNCYFFLRENGNVNPFNAAGLRNYVTGIYAGFPSLILKCDANYKVEYLLSNIAPAKYDAGGLGIRGWWT